MVTRFLVSCLGLVITTFCFAEECKMVTGQAELTVCSIQDYQLADDELNRIYRKIVRTLSSQQKDKLTTAQRMWIKFRDANCDHQTFDEMGTSRYDMLQYTCLKTVTSKRIDELKTVYSYLFGGQVVNPSLTTRTKKANQINPQLLIGSWQSIAPEYQLQIHFSLEEGISRFGSTLNSKPFESGLWKLINEQLIISTLTGTQLYSYTKVIVEGELLTLYELEGRVEHYKKVQ